jgi:hypothetical protein
MWQVNKPIILTDPSVPSKSPIPSAPSTLPMQDPIQL